MGLLRTPSGRFAAAVVGAIAVVVAAGLLAFWPGEPVQVGDPALPVASERAEVTSVSSTGCEGYAGHGCRLVGLRLQTGRRAGEATSITLAGDLYPTPIQEGDEIRVSRNVPGGIDPTLADRLPIDDLSAQPYSFLDFERRDRCWCSRSCSRWSSSCWPAGRAPGRCSRSM